MNSMVTVLLTVIADIRLLGILPDKMLPLRFDVFAALAFVNSSKTVQNAAERNGWEKITTIHRLESAPGFA